MRVRKTKKLLSGLLAVLFVLFSLPLSALAEEFTPPSATKVEVENVTIIEGTSGYETTDYDSQAGGQTAPYFRYNYSPSFTVTLTDGTVLEGEGSVEYEGRWYGLETSDGQSAATPWGVGVHTVTASILGVETTFTVEITESPVAKLQVENVTLIEGTNGYETTDYDSETGEYISYYRYVYYPTFTMTMTDGTILTGIYGVDYKGEYYSLETVDGQSAATPWGLGAHTVTASILGVETTFTVEIVESPYVAVEVVEVEPLRQGYDGYTGENGEVLYPMPGFFFKVTSKDGSSFTGYSKKDDMVTATSDQETHPWTPGGENLFTVQYLNVTTQASAILEPVEDFEYMEQDGGLFITSCNDIAGDTLTLPSQIDGKPVTGLLSLGNASQTVRHVVLPDSVTTIGESAFIDAYQLQTVTVGSGVQHLDLDMFRYCYDLTAVSVAVGNPYYTDIDGVVYNKAGDTLVLYPFGKGENYVVPAGVANIDILGDTDYDFLNISFDPASTQFVTEDGVTYDAGKTKVIFCDKEKAGAYDMPDTVTQIVDGAFEDCTQLTSVAVSENVTSIVYRAFADCASLAEVSLPEKLQSIDAQAFAGAGLESIDVPQSVTEIGERAFSYCNSLESVNISDLAAWCEIDFDGLFANPLYNSADLYLNGAKVTSLEFPDGITAVKDYAFPGCVSLTDITIPGSVTSIGDSAFSYCTNLESVTLPEGLVSIEGSAFEGCTSLAGITIPDSVTSIGDSAFSGCAALTSITIPGGVTYIGHGAFSSCMKLRTITILEGVTSIGDYAFGSCASLTDVTIPDSVTSIGNSAFSNCTSLTELAIPDSVTYIGSQAFYGCPLKEINLPQGMENTGGEYTFSGTAITSLTLPESVTTITYAAFADCSQLATIDIPSGVMSMQGYAFDDTAWYDAQPDGPVYLEHVFYGYKGGMPADAALELKAGTTVVADYALENQQALKTLTLPEGLKTLGSYSLYDCNSLTELYIPASVTQIDTSAFVGCSSLASIEVAPDNRYYKSVDGVLFSKDGSTLLWCPRRDATWYEVPAGVERIATGAFSDSGVSVLKVRDSGIVFENYSVGYRAYGWLSGGGYYDSDFGYGGCDFDYQHVEIICPAESTAYAYAKQNHLLATVPDEVVLESPDSGVSLTTTEDVLEPGTQLVVEPKEVESLVIVGADNYRLDTAVALDISLENAGQTIQPNGRVTVSIPVPEGLDGKRCRVLYIREDGTITNMKAVYENGCLVFDTTHFSQYMVAEAEVIYGDVTGEGDVTATDALNVLQHVTGKIKLEGTALQAADVDGQNGITANDALQILQFATRKIDLFPVEG